MGSGPNLLRQLQDGGGGGDINYIDDTVGVMVRVPQNIEAASDELYSYVGYWTRGHYASWYATAAYSFLNPALAFTTEAGAAFWSGVFRTGKDVSPEFYAVSNGITRVSGTALTLLLFPWSASTTLSMTLGGGAVLWGLDQTVTGGYELATGQEHHTFGGQALSKVFGETAGNLLYDWGPPTTASLNALRNAAGWFKNLLRNPSKAADDFVDTGWTLIGNSTGRYTFRSTGNGTNLVRTTRVGGTKVRINSGHGYDRAHSTGDFRNTGLSMDDIDNAVVDDIIRFRDAGGVVPSVSNAVPYADRMISINGLNIGYRFNQLLDGTINITTYWPK
jgi:hypothetical protein